MKWISENDDDQAMDQAHCPLILTVLGMVPITACGGGSGSTSNTGSGFVPPPAQAPKGANISITLTNIDSQSIAEINPITQGVIRIVVTDDNGVAVLYVTADDIDGAGR